MPGFSLPSATLLAQSILSGVFVGALYGLMGLGLSLSWGLLRLINLAHFAFAFLAAYLCWQLAQMSVDPLLTLVVIVPAFFALGAALHWVMARFAVTPFNSLLLTFGLMGVVEAVIQSIWTADFRKLESSYANAKFKVGALYVPIPEFITLLLALALSMGVWAVLRYTDLGKALRAAAEDAPIAAAFGINQKANALLLAGTCSALASIAGVCLALSFTLAPSQMYAWIGVVFAAVMLGGLGRALGPIVAGTLIGVSEAVTMAVTAPSWAPIVSFTLLIVVLLFRPGARGMTSTPKATPIAIVGAALLLAFVPRLGLPAFYDSLLYLMLSWVVLATSWNILSGYTGYFSFGHGAFFGAGIYTTSTLLARYEWPFLWTLPAAASIAALLGLALGAVVFRVRAVRGELFALLTLAVTFVIGTIVVNTPLDGGQGVSLTSVPVPKLGPTPSSTFYLLALAAAALTLLIAWAIAASRFGAGLFAIHDDEDAAEVMGVPTYRYKLAAFAISCALAGVAGAIQALFLSYVTAGDIFTITVPLTVVLMSVLGGTRHWAGPAVGAVAITALLYSFTAADHAIAGKAAVGVILIAAILFMPDGILLRVQSLLRRRSPAATASIPAPPTAAAKAGDPAALAAPKLSAHERSHSDAPLLSVRGLHKRFKGVRALAGVDVDVRRGEILGLLGPNGSGKSTFVNVVSGHFAPSDGRIVFEDEELGGAPAHRIAAAGIARTYQIPRPFARQSVLDNVALAAMFGGAVKSVAEARRQAMTWLEFTGLEGKASARPDDLNLHQRKFLELARALASRPRLVLLDEVLCGLTPSEIDAAVALIRRIRDQGATIVFVEHVMRAVMALTDRIVVFNHGELLAEGSAGDVMQRPDVMTAYLGQPAHA